MDAFVIVDDTDTADDTYAVEVLVVVVMVAEGRGMMNYADTLDHNRELLLPLQPLLPSVKIHRIPILFYKYLANI